MKRSLRIVPFLFPFFLTGVRAEAPRLSISLDQAVQASLDTSAAWKSAHSAAMGAENQALAQRAPLMPRLSLDGSYRYATEIPQLAVAPGSPSISFTTHNSYSIGPSLSWTAFSGGALTQSWRSAQAIARAQNQQADAIRRHIRLAARLAYFQAQLAADQVRLYAESYRVESDQCRDIRLRYQAGESARVDLLASEQTLLSRERQLLQARTNLATAVRDLTTLTRLHEGLDAIWPMGPETAIAFSETMPSPTLVVALEPAASSIKKMQGSEKAPFDRQQPSLQFLSELAESSRRSAKALEGGYWPTLSVLASLMRQYPNGPIKEDVTQKTFGVNLSFPLFSGGSTLYAERAARSQVNSLEEKREQSARDLMDSWTKSHDQAASLRLQQVLSRRSVEKASAVAQLRYQAYLAGQSRYLDVEDANLRVLQAKIDAATTDVNLLIQLANLESLSKE
jgi:outer membrane protein, protease secretion system